jgi:KUP system potassium uptake protein
LLERTGEDNPRLHQFIDGMKAENPHRVAGTAVYLAAHRETVPYALADNLKHNKVLHERVVLLTVVTERVPYVAAAERMTLEPLGKGFTQMTLRFGFAEAPAVPAALEAHRAEFPIDIAETSFFLGRETPVPKMSPDLTLWREKLYAFMTLNAVSAAAYFQIPPKRVVELGAQVEL